VLRRDFVGIDPLGEPDRPAERSVTALRAVDVLSLVLVGLLLLAGNGEHGARNGDLDFLGIDARNFGADGDFLLAVDHVE